MQNFKYLNEIINLILEIDPNMRISISTNGTNLKEFLNFDNIDKLEAIHISRHHTSDEINNEIEKFLKRRNYKANKIRKW